MSPIKVLLVEDEILVRFVLTEELQELGWKITEVGTADEAIDLLSSGIEVDLIITDVNMPGTADGFELARVAREQRPNAKIAIITGRPYPAVSEICDLFLRKPFSDVGAVFRDLMAQRA